MTKKKSAGKSSANQAKTITSAVRKAGAKLVKEDVMEKTGIVMNVVSNPKPGGAAPEWHSKGSRQE